METILWQILPIVISISVPGLLVLAVWIAKKAGAKLDLAKQSAINDLVINLTMQGVAYAEQIAKQRAKENEQINGSRKLYLATDYVLDHISKHNIDSIAATEIQKRIEAVLGMETMSADAVSGLLPEIKEEDF